MEIQFQIWVATLIMLATKMIKVWWYLKQQTEQQKQTTQAEPT